MKRNNLVVFNNLGSISQKENFENKGDEELKNIYKRKDGRYVGKKTIKGKEFQVYGVTKIECYEKLKKAIKQDNFLGKDKKSATNSIYPEKFFEFAVYWFENFKKNNIVEASQRNYINCIKRDIKQIDCNVSELNIDILQKFANSLQKTRKKEYCLMIVKQVVKFAYKLQLIKMDYGSFIEKGKIMKRKVTSFSLDDQKIFLENLGTDKFSVTIYTLLLTGCRPNELQTIKKSNIKNNLILIEGTKTKNARRWIKISDYLQNLLTNQTNEIIFDKFNVTVFGRKFKKFLNSLGIDGTLYMLRHTFATNLFYLGVSDKERQSYMGHSSSILTNDVYTDFDPTVTKKDILNLYINLYPEF